VKEDESLSKGGEEMCRHEKHLLSGMDALKPHTKMGVMVSGGASDATSQFTINPFF
jgi:hypothetical protein